MTKISAVKPEDVIKIGVEKDSLEQNVLLLRRLKIDSDESTWQIIGFLNVSEMEFNKSYRAEGSFKQVYCFKANGETLKGSYALKFYKDDSQSVMTCIENTCESGVSEKAVKDYCKK